jgi:hypothetical protein
LWYSQDSRLVAAAETFDHDAVFELTLALYARFELLSRHLASATTKHSMSISATHETKEKRKAEYSAAPSLHCWL